jgi:hypothetical protein
MYGDHALRGPRTITFRCSVTIHHAACGQVLLQHDMASDTLLSCQLNHIINDGALAFMWCLITLQASLYMHKREPVT